MYQRTIDKIGETVLTLYNEGYNSLQISQRVGSSKLTVKKVLSHFGIDYTYERLKKQEENKNLVIKLYSEGVDQLKLEKDLKMTRKTIRNILDNSIGRRSKSEAGLNRYGTELDEHCFDDLNSPEAAYWIGFLYADGHLAKNALSVSVTLQDRDSKHLDKLQKFIKSNKPPKKRNQKEGIYCNYGIFSEVIYNRFKELGFDNNKSHSANPPKELINSIDFWRGVMDGDGCLHEHEFDYLQLHLCGTKETIKQFIKFVENRVKVKNPRLPRNTTNSLYEVAYYKDGENIADLLYKDATVYLDRKYEIYQNWIK